MASVTSQRLAAGWMTRTGGMLRSRRRVRGSSRGGRANESTRQAGAFCPLGQRIDGKVGADNNSNNKGFNDLVGFSSASMHEDEPSSIHDGVRAPDEHRHRQF